MDYEKLKHISRIFDRVLTLPPERRTDYIDTLCGNDPVLQQKIEELLAIHDQSEELFENHLLKNKELFHELDNQLEELSQEYDVFTGQTLGRWTLTELLGRGGMGSVYKAERTDDGGIRQACALKIIHKSLVTPLNIDRFKLEQQILAGLQHPNIAGFIDSGITPDGIPYMVMEYVEGVPLTDYCNKHCFSVEQRLGLFNTVCRAIQYAHKNLVVHRDLKPENILVTQDYHVKILDFGIAKLLDPDLYELSAVETQPGMRLMSLGYAAPEQVSGNKVTTATDIYALGILLYQLLTDLHPFDFEKQSYKKIEKIILENEPDRPSQKITQSADPDQLHSIAETRNARPDELIKQLKGDLDAIVQKTLNKDPERRYESAEALEADIDRHLKGLPIYARPDSVGYRGWKFVKRHRTGVITAVTIFLFFTGLAVLYTVQVTAERNRAEVQQAHAEAAFTFLADMLKGADPDQTGGEEVTARELLEEGTRRASAELQNDPILRASVLHTIGEIYSSLGDNNRADTLLTDALDLRWEHYGPAHSETGQTLLALASVHHALDRYAIADSLYRLAGQAFASKENAVDRAKVFDQRALLESNKGYYQTSDSLTFLALELRRQVLPPDHPDIAESLVELAYNNLQQKEFFKADSLLRRALAIQQRHYGTIHSEVAGTINNLGYLAMRRADFAAADTLYAEAIQIYKQLQLYDNPHPSLATTLSNRGSLLRQQGRLDEAIILLREALDQRLVLKGKMDPLTATTMSHLASAFRQQERYNEAEPLYEAALETRRTILGDDHPIVATSLNNLGLLYFDLGLYEKAETYLRDALRRWQERLGPTSLDIAAGMHNLARTLVAQGKYAEAEATFREALAMRRETLSQQDPGIANTLKHYADLLRNRNRTEEACSFYQEALMIYTKAHGPEHAETAGVREALGGC